MKIVVLCEGRSEAVLKKGLREFVNGRATGAERTGIKTKSLDSAMFRRKLGAMVRLHLDDSDVAGVIALTDVYPKFDSAQKAKEALQACAKVGERADDFRTHAAQFELEAWLLPFWDEIAKGLSMKAQRPGANPEAVNGRKPPSRHLKELFRKAGKEYEKVINARKWLTADRLETAAKKCPELKLFLNSMLEFARAEPLP